MECQVKIDGKPFNFQIEGDFFWGKNEVLYDADDNVIAATGWQEEGFNILTLLSAAEHKRLVDAMRNIIKHIFNDLSVVYDEEFNLENYHKYVDENLHQEVIQKTRFLTYKDLDLNMENIAERVSGAINCKLGCENPLLDKEVVILRISRPNSLDINPPHRDGYLDIWRHTLNLWLPVVGCNGGSSLPIIPRSHKWNEKDVFRTNNKGASIGGLKYHVPGIAKTTFGLNMLRPNPKIGEVLIFTPFLIHGCAVNLNEDTTRFSLELRLFNKAKLSRATNG
jgi:ectoine hydroxylase-related dioxygenase (phytanoyl-CoA dioxygenase family)